jgi:pimeloyl-ACP methyl ester carboxylesterase
MMSGTRSGVEGHPVIERDVTTGDDRVLHVYDTGGDGVPVVWHHGTPNVGAPPTPLFPAAERLGLRWVGYDRPGYGGSSPQPGRTVASAAADVAVIADALALDRIAVMGHSGGSAHALACAALLPDRVAAAVAMSSPAPRADGLDWFAGMADGSAASLRAAVEGRAALEAHLSGEDDDDIGFAPADWAALEGDWAWMLEVVGPATAQGPAAQIDDDLAYVAPWGFDVEDVRAPVLVVCGGLDRMIPPSHGSWLASHLPSAELWLRPDEGHVSVLSAAEDALEWLATRVAP